MKLYDLHCDTAGELYSRKLTFNNSTTHINAVASANIFPYTQVFAIWTPKTMCNNEAYGNFFATLDYFRTQAELPPAVTPILAVEGARILDGDLSRLDVLHAAGVRVMTLVWSGTDCIGGSHDTKDGLTAFGEQVVRRCFELGIIPCLSHASDTMIHQVCDLAIIADCPVIASHSNARAVCDHPRNLSDQCARRIFATGGVVGLSLAPQHLVPQGADCTATDVARHARHFLSLGGAKQLCLGCDYDGIDTTPADLPHVGKLDILAKEMHRHGFTADMVDDIFWSNGKRFFARSFTSR